MDALMFMRITKLPYITRASGLSRNGGHGSIYVVAKAIKKHRQWATWAAIEAGAKRLRFTGRIPVRIIVHPAHGTPPDEDNVIGSKGMKAYLDGIADALDVNDQRFTLSFAAREPKRRPELIIEVGHAPLDEVPGETHTPSAA